MKRLQKKIIPGKSYQEKYNTSKGSVRQKNAEISIHTDKKTIFFKKRLETTTKMGKNKI